MGELGIGLGAEIPCREVGGRRIEHWDTVREDILAAHERSPDAPPAAGDRGVPMECLLQLLAFLKSRGLSAARILMDRSGTLKDKPERG